MYDKLTADALINGEELKSFFWDLEQGKDAYSHHCYSAVYWKSIRKEKEIKATNQKGSSILLSVCKWHDDIYIQNPNILHTSTCLPHNTRNLEQDEQSWMHHTFWLPVILQIYSNQNSMVLEGKQTWRPMEQNREPRNKVMHLQSTDLQQWGKDRDSSTNGGRKTGYLNAKETGPNFTPYTDIYLKWIKFLNIELNTLRLLEEIKGKISLTLIPAKFLKIWYQKHRQ